MELLFFAFVISFGFFATITALVAIAYRQQSVAEDATKVLGDLPKASSQRDQEAENKEQGSKQSN